MAVKPHKDRKTGEIIPGWWQIDWYPMGRKGPRRQRQFQGTQGEALAYEMEMRRAGRRQAAPINPRINEVMPDWKADYANNHLPNTVRDCNNCLVHLVPFFGKLYFAEFSPSLVEEYKRKWLDDGVTRRTINKELSYLSSFLGWAHENSHCSERFRPKKFPPKMTKAALPQVLHPEELQGVIDHLEPQYKVIALLGFHAGLRRTEALTLQAEQVNLKAGYIVVRGKGNKERIVPITTEQLGRELVKAINKRSQGHLFINPKTEKPYYSIRKALIRASEAAGVKQRVYMHLLRHCFGTHAMGGGVHLRAIQGMMGHSSSQTTEMYTHLAQTYLSTEARKIGNFLEPTSTDDVGGDDSLPKGQK